MIGCYVTIRTGQQSVGDGICFMARMTLGIDQIVDHPEFWGVLQRQSRALIGTFEDNPRPASVFATQQRWLMAHAAFALYFRNRDNRFQFSEFLTLVEHHKIASRNTADAFIKEMVQYQLARVVESPHDRRTRPLEPTEVSLHQVSGWLLLHLATLDSLDGGARAQGLLSNGSMLARIQPLIADALLTSPTIREPVDTFALFTWLNGGGVVMDRIMTSIVDIDSRSERISTGIASLNTLIGGLVLSRSHLMRKLREAEAMGSLGWEGRPDHSNLWISQGFRREYAAAQAVKLAIIDNAYAVAMGRHQIDRAAAQA